MGSEVTATAVDLDTCNNFITYRYVYFRDASASDIRRFLEKAAALHDHF